MEGNNMYMMMEFITLPETAPFVFAIAVMMIIGLLEGITTLLGFAFSSLVDNLLPDFDVDVDMDLDLDIDMDLDLDAADGDMPELEHGAFSEFLTWLRIKEVPVIAILIAFLTSFGITGLILQQVTASFIGHLLPLIIAVPATMVLCLPGVRLFAGVLSKIMPKDETSAVSSNSFKGRMAKITIGTAEKGEPAEAKLKDEHSQTHYIMVEPAKAGDKFAQGSSVLIVGRKGTTFLAIDTENEHLKQQ